MAEEIGLMVPIGLWVLRQACSQAARWPLTPGQAPLGVVVNLSAGQLAHTELPDVVARVLAETRLNPDRLCMEITENTLHAGNDSGVGTLAALKRLGVRLSVDDFGTGYSSIVLLKHLPLDTLKIGRAFVDGLGRDPQDSHIVAAVVNLAKSLGVETVVEGVERKTQLTEARRLGVGLGQGNHFSRPRPARALRQILREDPRF
jgi:EAL domain-containing protein (putative c-di-GMP-specific phosphodiesterase class I)